MEKAVLVRDLGSLQGTDPGYNRLYFGSEFCQRLIPSWDEVKEALDFCLKRNWEFSLVTPYVTNEGLEKLLVVMKSLLNSYPRAEVIINDWGVLRLLNRQFQSFVPVLGRLLTKQKRGPRIMNIKDKIPLSALGHFQASNIDTAIITEFLRSQRVERVELDNLLQGIRRQDASLKASLYFPFAYISTSRFCLSGLCTATGVFLRKVPDCREECRQYSFRLKHKSMPVDLLLQGSTYFFRNDYLPADLEKLNIDRIVYQPGLPL